MGVLMMDPPSSIADGEIPELISQVLAHVADGAGGVVEAGSALEAERLVERDGDGLDQIAVHLWLALEKPIGTDEDSARELNRLADRLVPADRILRIDHFRRSRLGPRGRASRRT
jgi:glucose-6-phosphate 1-dehydrogenase